MTINKVLFFAAEDESSRLIFNAIKNDCIVEKVILEKPQSRITLLKKRVKVLGTVRVFGQVLFLIFNSFILSKFSRSRILAIMDEMKLSNQDIDNSLVHKVSSINSDEVLDILKSYNPDVVLVNGTRIISKKILESTEISFINMHVGITPKYRGLHGAYWALVNKDQQNCGLTVHLVDSGIDTGKILYQSLIQITKKDNLNTYPFLQIGSSIPLIIKAINDVSSNRYVPLKRNIPSKFWTHPTLLEYLIHRIFHGVK